MKFLKNTYQRLKINLKEVDENFENYFPKIKHYRGWVDVSIEPAVYALFCAVFDLSNKKDVEDKIIDILILYKEAPLLKGIFKDNQAKRGFSRFISFLMLREIARKINEKEKGIFDKFNNCIND